MGKNAFDPLGRDRITFDQKNSHVVTRLHSQPPQRLCDGSRLHTARSAQRSETPPRAKVASASTHRPVAWRVLRKLTVNADPFNCAKDSRALFRHGLNAALGEIWPTKINYYLTDACT